MTDIHNKAHHQLTTLSSQLLATSMVISHPMSYGTTYRLYAMWWDSIADRLDIWLSVLVTQTPPHQAGTAHIPPATQAMGGGPHHSRIKP